MPRNDTTYKIIIGLIVLVLASYVLFSFGAAPPVAQDTRIANYGNAKVKMLDVSVARRTAPNFQGVPADQMEEMQVRGIAQAAIIRDNALAAGIVVSDDELRDYIIEQRKGADGSFLEDEEWSRIIRRGYRVQVSTFEEYLRDHNLKTAKYSSLFGSSAFIPESEVQESYLAENNKVNLELLILANFDVSNETRFQADEEDRLKEFFEANKDEFVTGPTRQIRFVALQQTGYREQVEVTDEEIQAFYDERREQRYKTAEQARANHILIKTDSRSDEEALKMIQDIEKEIQEGLDFGEAGKKYSEDASNAPRGGDLGFFGRGRMVPPFEKVAFELANGAISEPVKTSFGYHLIQKVDQRQEGYRELKEVEASIRNELTNNKATDLAAEELNKVRDSIIDGGKEFQAAVEEAGFETKLSRFFDQDNMSDLGSELGRNFQIRRQTFEMKEMDEVSRVVSLPNMVVLFQWVAQGEPTTLEWEVDKTRIRNMSNNLASKILILDTFAAVREKAAENPEASLKELAADYDFVKDNHTRTTGFVNEAALPWELRNLELDFMQDVFALPEGEFIAKIEAENPAQPQNRWVLARVTAKEEADMAAFEESRADMIAQIRNEKGITLLQQFLYDRNEELDPNGDHFQKLLEAYQGFR
jgi:peptidyl-prolyl cis-trans isomerase D